MRVVKHRLSGVDPESLAANCAHCGPVKIKLKQGIWRCRTAWQEQKRDYRRRNSQQERERSRRRGWRAYGIEWIDGDAYEKLLRRQEGVCAVCRQPPSSDRRLAVDHDHVTGAIRGLLCDNCNLMLGSGGDDPARLRAAADYLEKAR